MLFRRLFKNSLLLVSLFYLFCSARLAVIPDREPVIHHLDSRRELFVDSLIIGSMRNTRLELHHPVDQGPVLFFDRPWEGPFCGYCTIIRDGDLFRLYYRGLRYTGKEAPSVAYTCYAESRDGFSFTRPGIGLYEVSGSMDNNVILAETPATHNFSSFLDTRPGVSESHRYKALGGSEESGLLAFVSGDGIHWQMIQEEPVFRKGKFDSQNAGFWSGAEQCYVCYFRTWTGEGYGGFRSVSRTTSKDFLNWTEPVRMDFGNTPGEHLYTNQTHPYYRAPHIYIAVAARFMPGRQVLTADQASSLDVNPDYSRDCSDAVLLSSRGGYRYNRTFMEGFIAPGVGPENWTSRSNYPALNVVETGPDEMSIYVNQNYAQPRAHLRRYSLRIDGFVSVYAPYSGGEMTTTFVTFKGSQLSLNFQTSAAGEIRVEIQDENGTPVPGCALSEATPLYGNEIERAVSWTGGGNVEHLSGKPVRLRFVMKDAHLYSFQVR